MSQVAVNAISAACLYAVVALGFALIYHAARFFHFAHGAVCTIAAYGVYYGVLYRLPLWLAGLMGVAVGCAAGVAMYQTLLRPLWLRGTGSLGLLLASLGIYIVAENGVALAFGDETQVITPIAGSLVVAANVRVGYFQILTVLCSLLALGACGLLLRYSRLGLVIRAVSADSELGTAVGIDVGRVILFAFVLGSFLGGLGGVLSALDLNATPTMGLRLLLFSVVAAIAAGVSRPLPVFAGAALVAGSEHFGAMLLPSQWQDTIVFGVLLGFLLLRPQGIWGDGRLLSLAR